MEFRLHSFDEKPEVGTLCLVFFNWDISPDMCRYLDDTVYDVETFGSGEGFYREDEAYSVGLVDPNWILGWVDLDELDERVKGRKNG